MPITINGTTVTTNSINGTSISIETVDGVKVWPTETTTKLYYERLTSIPSSYTTTVDVDISNLPERYHQQSLNSFDPNLTEPFLNSPNSYSENDIIRARWFTNETNNYATNFAYFKVAYTPKIEIDIKDGQVYLYLMNLTNNLTVRDKLIDSTNIHLYFVRYKSNQKSGRAINGLDFSDITGTYSKTPTLPIVMGIHGFVGTPGSDSLTDLYGENNITSWFKEAIVVDTFAQKGRRDAYQNIPFNDMYRISGLALVINKANGETEPLIYSDLIKTTFNRPNNQDYSDLRDITTWWSGYQFNKNSKGVVGENKRIYYKELTLTY